MPAALASCVGGARRDARSDARYALLNDASPHLIDVHRWLQRGLTVTIPMVNRERDFYAHRERFNTLLRSGKSDSAEAACLFYFLNRTGHNGLCCFNSRGEFNAVWPVQEDRVRQRFLDIPRCGRTVDVHQ